MIVAGRANARRRASSFGAALLAVAGLAGCSGPRFAREPMPAADLSGHWILDAAASDDAAKMIAAAVPKPRPIRPLQATSEAPVPVPTGGGQRGGGRRGGRTDSSSSTQQATNPYASGVTAWGRVRPVDFVSAFAMPPSRLDIVQAPARLAIGVGGARERAIEPGDEEPYSVTDRYGSRQVRGGWDHDAFLIRSVDGNRLNVLERYRRRTDDRLETRVEFSATGIKSLKVRAVYRRATAEEIAAPAVEGPPPPAAR